LRADRRGDHGLARRRAADQGDARSIQPDRFHRERQFHDLEEDPLADRSARCQVNWVVCDSDWEAEFCRAAEANRRVHAYAKNQGLGFEVPYLLGSVAKKYLPDFIVRVDDGHGDADPLNLVVEIKGYRGEDAKDKANTMDSYWVPGVNNLGTSGRWAFAEFKESVYVIAANFDALIERAVAGRLN